MEHDKSKEIHCTEDVKNKPCKNTLALHNRKQHFNTDGVTSAVRVGLNLAFLLEVFGNLQK